MTVRTIRAALCIAIGSWPVGKPVAASGPENKPDVVVTVEGRAAGSDRNAMEQARQDALRKAVEQACGAFISAQSKTRNYAVVYDKVMSLAAGYVNTAEVLDRRVEGGVSICKVRAHVSTVSFEKEWARLLHTLEAEGNPRCVVVIVEDNNVDDLSPPRANGVAQAALEAFFIDKGVQLMDRGASQETRNRDIALAALKDDIKKLAAMAASFKADVVIRGSVEARRSGTSEMAGRTIYMWRATLNVRAYHTDSAQMLMSRTYSTTKATVNQNGGGDEAIRKCVEDHAGAILREVAEGWRKRQNVRRTCQLTLENCSRGDYKAFEKALREVDGVQEVRLRELVSEVCQVEVDWSYDLERLVSRIEKLHVSGMTFVITEQTHDRATVKLVKKSP